MYVDTSGDRQVCPDSGGCPVSVPVQSQYFMAMPRVVLLKPILMPLEQGFWILLDADSDSVGLG